jgi:superfamily I DNA and RNA helicase
MQSDLSVALPESLGSGVVPTGTTMEDWLKSGAGHGFINAIVGSGQTIVLCSALSHLKSCKPECKILYLCYNKVFMQCPYSNITRVFWRNSMKELVIML